MEQCGTCRVIPKLLGKDIFLPLLGREYSKLYFKDIEQDFRGLRLELVGGLKTRGWTTHDIDITGNHKDVHTLAERLEKRGIMHPIHFCRKEPRHSHLLCAWNGLKLAFTGKGY